jgi:hypothetical protein
MIFAIEPLFNANSVKNMAAQQASCQAGFFSHAETVDGRRRAPRDPDFSCGSRGQCSGRYQRSTGHPRQSPGVDKGNRFH